jgi:hypothetical protein
MSSLVPSRLARNDIDLRPFILSVRFADNWMPSDAGSSLSAATALYFLGQMPSVRAFKFANA